MQEVLIGAVLGIAARLAISALQLSGAVVAQQPGLGFVTSIDPTLGQQGVITCSCTDSGSSDRKCRCVR